MEKTQHFFEDDIKAIALNGTKLRIPGRLYALLAERGDPEQLIISMIQKEIQTQKL